MIKIIVKDIKDNIPFLDNLIMLIRIRDVSIKSTICKAKAHDADHGDKSPVHVGHSRCKWIDEFTCLSSLYEKIDRELDDHYEVNIKSVEHWNMGVQSLCNNCILNITVNNINNNISIFPMNNFTIRMHEDIQISTVIPTLTVIDPECI